MPQYNVAWAVVLLPLLGVLASFLFETPRRAAQAVVACNALAFAASVFTLFFRIAHRHDQLSDGIFLFFQTNPNAGPNSSQFAPNFQPQLGVRVDNFSAAFAAVVLFVSVLVLWHATSSMRKDAAYRRIFWCSSLLIFAVVGAVLSPNLFQLVFMSMIASSATYVLMTHWWEDAAVAEKARRGFAWLLAGDAVALMAAVLVFARMGTDASTQTPTGSATINDPLDFSTIGLEVGRITSNSVSGVGSKTLLVIGILVAISALIRLAIVPAVAWLGSASEAPLPGVALSLGLVTGTGGILLARMWPLLLAVPHELSVIAVIGVASAVVCALVALTQDDIAYFCSWIAGAQLGVIVATLGVGGYAPALEELAMFFVLNSVLVLTCGNLVRVFSSRDISEMGGAWNRARGTAILLAAWAVFVCGLDLSNYNAISAAWRNKFAAPSLTSVPGGQVESGVRVVVLAGMVLAAGLVAIAAVRLVAATCRGEPPARRGFNVERVRDVDRRSVATVAVLLAGLVALIVTGIPANYKGLTFSHFVFFGQPPFRPQSLPIVGPAIAWAIVIAAIAVAAWILATKLKDLSSKMPSLVVTAGRSQLGIESGLSHLTSRASVFVADIFRTTDAGLVDPLEAAGAENAGLVGAVAERAKTSRLVYQLLAALVVIAVAVLIAALTAAGVKL